MRMTLRTEVRNGVGVIVIDRPDALNALNDSVLAELADVFDVWRTHPDVDVIVMTGAGERAFVAGADIRELAQKDLVELGAGVGMQEFMDQLQKYPKPTIAAVNGYAFGGGFELALSCDIRIASERASFAFPELGLGIIPGATGTQRLTALAGGSVAMFHILTGERLSAQRAYEFGVVAEVVPDDQLLTRAEQVAQRIRAKAPRARQLAKTAVLAALPQHEQGQLVEKLAQAVLFGTHDRTEGMAAFLEKREPRFNGEAN